jgi:hypothetical protein
MVVQHMRKCFLVFLLFALLWSPGCEDGGSDKGVGFISIHIEPGYDPGNIDYAADRWGPLQALVADADAYGHKLTLLFSPQFARWVSQDSTRTALVKFWQSQGHEVGVHHHGPSHGVWDGYSDSTNQMSDADYQGTLSDMLAEVAKLSRDGSIRTANVGTTDDAVAEWPPDVPYEADGGLGGVSDLISTPQSVVRGGQDVTALRHAQYGTGIQDVTLSDIENAALNLGDGQVLGLVFHDQDYADNPALFRDLFQHLSEWGTPIHTVRSIL